MEHDILSTLEQCCIDMGLEWGFAFRRSQGMDVSRKRWRLHS